MMKMRLLVCSVLLGSSLSVGVDASQAQEAHPYRYAYYLFLAPPADSCEACYIPLLLTSRPLSEMAGTTRDETCIVITTYERDSIVRVERTVVVSPANITPKERHIRLRGRSYRYQGIGAAEVLRLLENPEGTIPIHRTVGMRPPAKAELEDLAAAFRARPGEVRVLATAAIRIPLDAVRAEASNAIGHNVVIEYGSARGNLKDAVMAGTEFDVALLLPDVDEELLKSGKITTRGVVVGKTDVAIGLRGDGTPDLSTPDTIKTAMLNARSLRWSDTGAALLTVNKILDTLKIRDAVKARHNIVPAPVPLGPGDYEINIYPLSEILANGSLRNAGPVTAELQVPVIVTATISSNTLNVAAAKALVQFLQGAAIEPVLAKNGFRR